MLNQIVLVGRLTETPKLVSKDNKKICKLKLEIPRSFKNAVGEYEKDYVECIVWSAIAEQIQAGSLVKGDLVGIKGRVQKRKANTKMEIVAEKVTFLSSKKSE